jgi:hypothetical protein
MRNLILAVLVAVMLTACGATATPTPMATVAAPWGAGDRSEYAIERGGKAQGTLVMTTTRKDDGHIISTVATVGPIKVETQVRTDRDLTPLGASRQLTGAGKADYAILGVYSNGKLSIQAKTADGDKAITINTPAGAWDNDQMLVSVRTLPLAESYTFAVTNMVSASATALKTQITVLGKESIDVPAGRFAAYKVELDFGPSKHHAWYDTAKPHHMVRYDNADTQETIVLTKVEAP